MLSASFECFLSRTTFDCYFLWFCSFSNSNSSLSIHKKINKEQVSCYFPWFFCFSNGSLRKKCQNKELFSFHGFVFCKQHAELQSEMVWWNDLLNQDGFYEALFLLRRSKTPINFLLKCIAVFFVQVKTNTTGDNHHLEAF